MPAFPRSSPSAAQCSANPNEKPTFLKPQAKPTPYFLCAWRLDARGGGCQPDSIRVQPDSSAQRSTTVSRLTPFGTEVPTERIDPSRTTFFKRNSTGSMPNASASLSICISAAYNPCGPPKPRNAPLGMLFVYTA